MSPQWSIYARVEDPMLEQVDAAEEGSELGSLQYSNLLAGPVDLWRKKPWWNRFSGRTCDPMRISCWSSLFLRNFTPRKGLTLEQ